MGRQLTIRTDLALEIREQLTETEDLPGVELTEETEENGIHVSRVVIRNEKGRKAMGKPIGTYLTIESGNMAEEEGEERSSVSETTAKYLAGLVQAKPERGILVIGLGNRDITPDALGPIVVENLLVTRHAFTEYQSLFPESKDRVPVAALAPGVMGQTGMEAIEVIRGIVKEISPDLVIVIDALAARSTERLNRTVQMTDTGISPGAGVGNFRSEINREVLNVPVIAIGVPTVIDAATIVRDKMERALQENGLTEQEIRTFLGLLREETDRMFVTPKNVDEAVRKMGEILADAINQCSFSERKS